MCIYVQTNRYMRTPYWHRKLFGDNDDTDETDDGDDADDDDGDGDGDDDDDDDDDDDHYGYDGDEEISPHKTSSGTHRFK